jgi:hypothetical protein
MLHVRYEDPEIVSSEAIPPMGHSEFCKRSVMTCRQYGHIAYQLADDVRGGHPPMTVA